MLCEIESILFHLEKLVGFCIFMQYDIGGGGGVERVEGVAVFAFSRRVVR